ncbi:hypothetical protein FVE85_6778 [Porphyridium purpureum]|uniref:Transmembrane protein n=1 Tax=Porphyridium purpureum TaxID=35688 RepID=A0A5J4Z8N4_PORPP|nr:hypothetical protein FVE85_6778 [Porphyridium purpureum]|eukprot:POR8283..scf295_1
MNGEGLGDEMKSARMGLGSGAELAVEQMSRAEAEKYFMASPTRLTNRLLDDVWLYVKNNHALLACVAAHRLNPFSRGEHRWCLVCSLTLSFFLAAVQIYIDALGGVFDMLYTYVLAPCALFVFDACLGLFATCEAVAGRDADSCSGMVLRCTGKLMLFAAAVTGSIFFVLGLVLVLLGRSSGMIDSFWPRFFQISVSSWLWSFPILAAYYVGWTFLFPATHESLLPK